MPKPIKISLSIFFIVLILVGGFWAFNFLSSFFDPTDYLKSGDQLFNDGKYSNALLSYQKALERSNTDPNIYSKMAKIYEYKGKYKDAIDVLKKGLEKNNASADLNYQIGEDSVKVIPEDVNYIDLAVSSYDKASASSNYKNAAIYKEARLLSIKSTPESFKKAKDLYSSIDYLPAKYELILFQIDDPDKALAMLNDLSKSTPTKEEDAVLTSFNSWTDFSKNLTDQLNNAKNEIVQNAARSRATEYNVKGYVAYKMDRCEFGVDFLKNAISESEKEVFYPEARLVLGECLKRLYKYDDAKNVILPVYEKQKDVIDSRLILRQIYRGLGDYADMKKMYDEILVMDSTNSQIRRDYAVDSENTGDWKTASDQYRWLTLNLTDKSVINGKTNADFSLNKAYLTKTYDILTYKLKVYEASENFLNDAQKANSKFIDDETKNELQTWLKYSKNSSDKQIEEDLLSKSQNLKTANAYYHTAVILNLKGKTSSAKDNALAAYDADQNGYISELSSNLLTEMEK